MPRSRPPGADAGATEPGEPQAAAREAGLRHVNDRKPGLGRIRSGRGFRYVDAEGHPVRDPEVVRRIRALAIPPAWREVWICPHADGHIQATGRDDRGRKQYRYHARWRQARDESKYGRLIAFAKALPAIRRRVEADLARPGLPREKVLAAVVRLLETTMIRVGNAEYARDNRSFGLTTLRNRHVDVEGETLRFRFRGKSGVKHDIELSDRRLAKIVRRCQDLPGQELFSYLDNDGGAHDVGSSDINDYLGRIGHGDFTAKDFRTWAGTVLASLALQEFTTFDSEAQAKRHIVRAIETVADRLGNTPAVCRKCYVHPAVLDSYLDGSLIASLRRRAARVMAEQRSDLRPEEAAVLALLQRRLAEEEGRPRHTTRPRRTKRES